MKRLWIAAVILCGVVGLCIGSVTYRHHCIEGMLDTLNQMEQAYTQGDIPQAKELAEQLARRYEQSSRILLCYSTHSDMAESQETVALLPTLLQQGSGDELPRRNAATARVCAGQRSRITADAVCASRAITWSFPPCPIRRTSLKTPRTRTSCPRFTIPSSAPRSNRWASRAMTAGARPRMMNT